jgi:hypothetical protein
MDPCIRPAPLEVLRFIQRLEPLRAYTWSRLWFCTMLSALVVAMSSWQVVAEVTGAPLENSPLQTMGTSQRGIVTTKSKLHVYPSTQSEVIGIAKESTQIQILIETESWLYVRGVGNIDGWIHRSLVRVEDEPLKTASDPPQEKTPADLTEILFASAVGPNMSMDPAPVDSPGLLGSDMSTTIFTDAASIPPETIVPSWFIELILFHLYSPEAYVIGALIIVLLLTVALQLRGARQLRRAMQEIGQILAILEEMYSIAPITPVREGNFAMPLTARDTATGQRLEPRIEFSAAEQVVLKTLLDQSTLQEGDLGKILDEKGYAGTLVKAVIGEILRKTGR